MTAIPSFHMAPAKWVMLQRIRFSIDLTGLLLLRMFAGDVHGGGWHIVVDIYNVAAWVTVLTIRPAYLPEAATTRNWQRQAWYAALFMFPGLVLAAGGGMVLHFWRTPEWYAYRTIGTFAGLALGRYLDVMLFASILQSQLRKLRCSLPFAIGLQAMLYGLVWWMERGTLSIAITAVCLSVCNGWLVCKYRSLWPAWFLAIVWQVTIAGP